MNKVFDFFKTVWAWFYERTVIWFIFAFFLLMGWGQLYKNELALQAKEEITHINVSIIQVQDMIVAVDRKFLLDVTKEKHKV